MTRILTALLAATAFVLATADVARAQVPVPVPRPTAEPSVTGTWVGYWNVAGTKVKLTATLRADGTYKVIMENGDFVSVEKGTYKYSDGVLTTEPEGGFTGTFVVTFDGADTMKVKGGGISIVYKRQ